MSVKASPESFWARVKSDGQCRVFVGHRNRDGYGRLRYQGKLIMAHRLAWILTYGEIAVGYEIDHICRNRACVEPTHLQVLDGKEHAVQSNSARYGLLWRHSKDGCEVRRDKNGATYCVSCRRRKVG